MQGTDGAEIYVVDNKPFLVANAKLTGRGVLLHVYRSVLVSVDGEVYRPVRELLVDCPSTLLESERLEDASMMMGAAERSVYLLNTCGAALPSRVASCATIRQLRARPGPVRWGRLGVTGRYVA